MQSFQLFSVVLKISLNRFKIYYGPVLCCYYQAESAVEIEFQSILLFIFIGNCLHREISWNKHAYHIIWTYGAFFGGGGGGGGGVRANNDFMIVCSFFFDGRKKTLLEVNVKK